MSTPGSDAEIKHGAAPPYQEDLKAHNQLPRIETWKAAIARTSRSHTPGNARRTGGGRGRRLGVSLLLALGLSLAAARVSPTYATPASTTLTTTASPTSVTLGTTPSTLQDGADLEGGNSPTGTISFILTDPNGGMADTESVTVSGNGAYSTPIGYTLPTTGTVTGTYAWQAAYSGDGNNDAAQAGPELVTVSPANPTLTTTASPTTATAGATLDDSATLAGGYFPTGTITFTLTDPSGGMADTETVAVSGNGTYTTPIGHASTLAGTYTWDASYSGDGNNNTAQATPELVTVGVASPALSTMATPSQATVGAVLTDSATLSGGSGPTGTITFTLRQGGCTGPVVDTERVGVNGNGTYTTPIGYATSAVGTYQWAASYSGDENNAATATVCGDEPVTVQYVVSLLYKPPANGNAGSTVPIKLELTNAAGQNVSSANRAVQALCVVIQGATSCQPAVISYSSQFFTYLPTLDKGGGYQFNVKTSGLTAGLTYQLLFRTAGEPSTVFHVGPPAVTFTLTK